MLIFIIKIFSAAIYGNLHGMFVVCSNGEHSYLYIVLASYPGRKGKGKKQPGTYCMRMREVPQQNLGLRIRLYIFCISYQYMSVNYSVSFR